MMQASPVRPDRREGGKAETCRQGECMLIREVHAKAIQKITRRPEETGRPAHAAPKRAGTPVQPQRRGSGDPTFWHNLDS